MAQGILPMTW